MFFSDIVGQEQIKQRLLQMVRQHRVPHAQLFYGLRGVGKLPLAVAYAQYLCCEHRSEQESCGKCPSCLQFSKLAHPDLHFVFPIVKPDSKPLVCNDFLPQFREAFFQNPYFTINNWFDRIAQGKQGMIYTNESDEIVRKLNLKTFEAQYKIMIVWQPERMHENCANKLLKILEEPLGQTVFIFVSDEPGMLLSTIRSRLQNIRIPPIEPEKIYEKLQQDFSLTQIEAQNFTHIASGSYAAAIELVQQTEHRKQYFESFVDLMRLAWKADFIALRKWSETLEKQGRESIKQFLQYAQNMLRENFIYNLHLSSLSYMTKEESDFSSKFAIFVNERNIELFVEEFQKAEREIYQNVNAKNVLFDLSLQCSTFLKE